MDLYKDLEILLKKNNTYDEEDGAKKEEDDAYRTQKLSYNNDGAGIGYYNAIIEVDNELKRRRLRHNIGKSKNWNEEKLFLEECEKSLKELILQNENIIQMQPQNKSKPLIEKMYTMMFNQPSTFDIEKSKINKIVNENYELNILLRNTTEQLTYYK